MSDKRARILFSLLGEIMLILGLLISIAIVSSYLFNSDLSFFITLFIEGVLVAILIKKRILILGSLDKLRKKK